MAFFCNKFYNLKSDSHCDPDSSGEAICTRLPRRSKRRTPRNDNSEKKSYQH